MRQGIRYIILLTSLLFAGLQSYANETADSLYNQANIAYSAGEYESAYLMYDAILKEGLESADLYYNMANAAFRSNQLGHAILYYEKSLKLDPSYEDAKKNLLYVSNYKEDQLESVPQLFLKTWLHNLFDVLTLKAWSSMSIVLFVLVLLGVIIYIFSRRLWLKKTGFYSSLVFLLFFLIAFSGALKEHHKTIHPNEAIIIAPSVVVKSSPSLSGTDLFILHEGTSVKIDETVGEWIEIKLIDGRVGWIPVTSQEII